MSSYNGVWLADRKIIAHGGVDLVHDLGDDLSLSVDDSEFRGLFPFNLRNDVTMTFNLTQRQVENMWVVYHGLRSLLAPCPSKRVYHNAFRHHKARVREKNRKRAERMIERMKKA